MSRIIKRIGLIVFCIGIVIGVLIGYFSRGKIVKDNIKFDYDKKHVKLNNGLIMPINGLGTYGLYDDKCVSSVKDAIKNGVRLIDTAYMYGNEEAVGRAIRESRVDRKEIFVITKLYPNQYDNPKKAIEEALKKLDIGYIDMMLLHHPGSDDVKAYKEIEKNIKNGKIKSVGLSNYYIDELKYFIPKVNIKPALVQNEIHPYYNDRKVVDYIQSLGIVVQSWYPFGGESKKEELLNNKILLEIAKSHNKSVAQVILRWDLQNGVSVIPGSSNTEHLKENLNIFDFELSDEEMSRIDSLNKNKKYDWY